MMRYFFILCLVLLVKAVLLTWLISTDYIGLGPDEAQYWTWSQHLDWGYYSKPPGIAWQIAFTTYLFGNTELGVRFGAVVIGFCLPLAVFFLARSCQLSPKTAFWSGIVMAFAPIGVMASLLSITDGGLVLFWTLGCIILVSALMRQQAPNYCLLGLLIMLGALYKWPIYSLWVLVWAIAIIQPAFRKKSLFAGMGLSLVGLLPSLIWNLNHDWVTFRHVAGNIAGTSSSEHSQGNALAFIGEQAALLSPILFIMLLLAYAYLVRFSKSLSKGLLFCGYSSLSFLFAFTVAAAFKKIQGNWCDFIYPAAIVFLCGYAITEIAYGKLGLKIGLGVSVGLTACTFMLPWVQSKSLWPDFQIPYKYNPFRHNVGWPQLTDALQTAGYNPEVDFLFGDKYQTCSILSFYGPGQHQAYFLNLQHTRLNQFSFWPGIAEKQHGKTGFFVVIENSPHMEKNFPAFKVSYLTQLQEFFSEVVLVGEFPLFKNNSQPVKAALIFKCKNYNGKEPPKAQLF
jgi:dolichyl-phosphate-mannose-protein mannosyltransferase